METYNLSRIMKAAWKTYKRYSHRRTFSECLKESWSIAKEAHKYMSMDIKIEKPVKKEVVEVKFETTIKEDYYASIGVDLSWDDCYNRNSRGYMGSQYCGD